MTLELVKVEEGLMTGAVAYHQYIKKTEREIGEMNAKFKLLRKNKREEEAKEREKEEKRQQKKEKIKLEAKKEPKLAGKRKFNKKRLVSEKNKKKFKELDDSP
jgi:ribosome biogenesis protein SSF1/2